MKSVTAASLTGLVDLVNPDPKTITIEAIAHGLGQINRWNGALEVPFSVAQHSILVFELFCRAYPQYRKSAIVALLHDAHEAYIGDWTTPAFAAFCEILSDWSNGEFAALAHHVRDGQKRRFDAAIYVGLGLEVPPIATELIAKADRWALAIEWRDLMPSANGDNPIEEPPFAVGRLKPLPPLAAAEKFLEVYRRELVNAKVAA